MDDASLLATWDSVPGQSRNETAYRFARVVLGTISSVEEDHIKLADTATQLIGLLGAAKSVEQETLLPSLATGHVSCSGAVHLEAVSRRAYVRWHLDDHSTAMGRLKPADGDIHGMSESSAMCHVQFLPNAARL